MENFSRSSNKIPMMLEVLGERDPVLADPTFSEVVVEIPHLVGVRASPTAMGQVFHNQTQL
jgi:hypothetical protein